MKDGYLNKCKDCVKKDASVRYIEKLKNTEWKEKERARAREKYKRLHYYEKYKYVAISTALPLSYKTISRKAHKTGLVKKGFEFHHWNYNLLNSGFIVSREAHKCIHRHMSFNRQNLFCYKENGEKLVDEKQAEAYFNEILHNEGYTEKVTPLHIPYKGY